MNAVPVTANCVWYIELRGPDAQATLGDWLDALANQPSFLGAELQVSAEQPELALIASRWAVSRPAVTVPAGAKHWTFEVRASR